MKKLKCIKCGLRFKDRLDPEDGITVNRELCWNCRFVWTCLGVFLYSIPEKINRQVAISIDGVAIKKKK